MTQATDLPKEARAFLDALAVGESGAGEDYTIFFGGDHFDAPPWPEGFPDWDGVRIGGVMTHAAGRYQFEPATWLLQQRRLGLPDFSPESQDHAAWDLACRVYRIDLLQQLKSSNALGDIANALQSTWTSMNAQEFPNRYRTALAAIGA